VAPSTVGAIDSNGMVRGASLGFTVLILGVLVTPAVAMVSGPVAGGWPYLATVVAVAVAGMRIDPASRPLLNGALVGLLTYSLAAPFLMFGPIVLSSARLWALCLLAPVAGAATVLARKRLSGPRPASATWPCGRNRAAA
jgi:hypothetical protein